MKSLLTFLLLVFCSCLILSCNVYAPLNSNNSDLDKLEEAQKCLKSNDYSCAIKQYQKISDSDLKIQKLCQTYLTKGGITLKVLNGTINQDNGQMLSKLARAIMPWTSTKSADFDSAKTYCSSFAANHSSDELAILLKTIAELSHCAIRMSKAHIFQGTSDADTACNFPPIQLGTTLIKQDIYTNSDPKGYPGMCYADVLTCYNDLSAVPFSILTTAGYANLSGAMKRLQDQLPGSADATATRLMLYGTFP